METNLDPSQVEHNNPLNPVASSPSQPPSPPSQQAHPDLSKPPAGPGESRPSPIWIDPAEHAANQARLQSLEEFKRQADQLAELKDNERVRLLAEKGQLDEAFKQTNERHEAK